MNEFISLMSKGFLYFVLYPIMIKFISLVVKNLNLEAFSWLIFLDIEFRISNFIYWISNFEAWNGPVLSWEYQSRKTLLYHSPGRSYFIVHLRRANLYYSWSIRQYKSYSFSAKSKNLVINYIEWLKRYILCYLHLNWESGDYLYCLV